jgi:hypothetical protein
MNVAEVFPSVEYLDSDMVDWHNQSGASKLCWGRRHVVLKLGVDQLSWIGWLSGTSIM